MTDARVRTTVRERNKLALRRDITEAALQLFRTQGFAATTVDQIVSKAGVSRRTFFHHFPTKEDVVLGDTRALGERVRSALEARPATESAWTALSEALRALEGDESVQLRLATAKLYHDAPSLRARHLEKHLHWQNLLAPDIARRLGLSSDDALTDPRPRAVIAAALSCLDVAVDVWRESGGEADLEAVFRECASAIRS